MCFSRVQCWLNAGPSLIVVPLEKLLGIGFADQFDTQRLLKQAMFSVCV